MEDKTFTTIMAVFIFLSAALMIIGEFIIDNSLLATIGFIGVIILLVVYLFNKEKYDAGADQMGKEHMEKVAKQNEQRQKEYDNMPPAKKLALAKQAFEHGQITLLQYEALKKNYGESNLIDSVGMNITANVSNKVAHDMRVEQEKQLAADKIAMGAVVGGVVGGAPGAIVGAEIAKTQVEIDLIEKSK